ncbi:MULTISPECIES: hypothetical protein [Halanaerobium]|jgi:uncharacterized membrane protein YdjX (TVP38/TMEM64 family)|uniref:SNARE associated Golgi protein n=1 Tax=Halanaerobium saccharolyticum TaxID=43595 RepID=A0A4R6RUT9_9FIRM|nr:MULTISPECIES: hypothetical protein [Halanaerobium]PUU90545.1 MAG: hypothetical protein CI949_2304 [Halanaerobium sp.]TDP90045.1 SNARE associated Golgi protein [Halanaerobium saccharolyticum]
MASEAAAAKKSNWLKIIIFVAVIAALGIVGGILFGPWLGTFYTALGSTIGAVAAFLAGKYVAQLNFQFML